MSLEITPEEQEAWRFIRERPAIAAIVARMMVHASAGRTKRQQQALDFIFNYFAASGGISPSYSEIAAALGLKSKSQVHRLIGALADRGCIGHIPGRARSIVVLAA